MPFDHERLEVYQLSLEFFDIADDIVERLRESRGRSHLADQLTRASLSIVNNIAEGAGKFSKGPSPPREAVARAHRRDARQALSRATRRLTIGYGYGYGYG
jgi:four helix bundle protein